MAKLNRRSTQKEWENLCMRQLQEAELHHHYGQRTERSRGPRDVQLFGCVQQLQPGPDAPRRSRKNGFCNKMSILSSGHDVRVEDGACHLPVNHLRSIR